MEADYARNYGIEVFEDDGVEYIQFIVKAVCKHLGFKDGKAFCRIHDTRNQLCRDYPFPNTVLKEGCGFRR